MAHHQNNTGAAAKGFIKLKAHTQTKIIKKSVIPLRPINMITRCKHVHRPEPQKYLNLRAAHPPARPDTETKLLISILNSHVKNKKYGNPVSISKCAAQKIKNPRSSSPWPRPHHIWSYQQAKIKSPLPR